MGSRILNLNFKKLLLAEIPSSITIDGHTLPIEKTIGSVPLNKLTLPTINVNFIENAPYYRSIDDGAVIIDGGFKYNIVNSGIIRYTVGASSVTADTSTTMIYKTGTDLYTLPRVPVVNINNIGTYVKNIDYRLRSDHASIEWIGNKPANNASFVVNYKWVNDGYFISHQLIDYLMKDVRGRVFNLITNYNVNIIDFKSVVDISDIYVSDAFNAFSFDFIITYPFTWTSTISDEDAIIANTFTFNLIVNDIDVDTISYTKG